MEEKEVAQEAPKKLSYEELENVARQLSEQSERLYMQLQEVNMHNTFKRLDYLFKVLENDITFDDEFVEKCTKEIVGLLTIPEQESKPEGNKE